MGIISGVKNFIQPSTTILGLHVTASSASMVVLEESGGELRLQVMDNMDFRREGLLDEADFVAYLKSWISEQKVADAETVLGISQEVSNIQVMDFPPNSEGNLASMVAYQTGQLAELSEDSFIHDYQIMRATEQRPCPVLVGVCLKGVVDARLQRYTDNGLELADLGMESVALANGCCALHPEIMEAESPQLLLNIDDDGSTVVIIWHGRMLYGGWLTCGCGNYMQAFAEREGIALESLSMNRQDMDVSRRQASEDQVSEVNNLLVSELHANLEQWWEQENLDAEEAAPGNIYITGEGGELAGMANVLEDAFSCRCQVAGLSVDEGQKQPVFSIAYGLALTYLDAAFFNLSLAPAPLKSLTKRKKRVPVLSVALGLLGLLLLTLSLWDFYRFEENAKIYQKQLDQLQRCESVVTELEDTVDNIERSQEVQVPIIEHGNRALYFADAIEQLSRSCADNEWMVYVGDELSIIERNEGDDRRSDSSRNDDDRDSKDGGFFHAFGQGESGEAAREEKETGRKKVAVSDLEPLAGLEAAGYTVPMEQSPYKSIRNLVAALNKTDLFEGVDLLPSESSGARDRFLRLWRNVLQELPERNFKSFRLRLPFENTSIVPVQEKETGR